MVVGYGRRVGSALVAAATFLTLGGTSASALSCAFEPGQDLSPSAVAAGTDRGFDGARFRDWFDGAVFGTVLSTRSDPRHLGTDAAPSAVLLDVTGVFGPPVESPVVIETDPDWGPNLEVGHHYFIPYNRRAGRYESGPCDPVIAFDEAEVPALVVATAEHWEASLAGADGTAVGADGGTEVGGAPVRAVVDRWPWLATAAAGLLLASLTWLRRRSRKVLSGR